MTDFAMLTFFPIILTAFQWKSNNMRVVKPESHEGVRICRSV